MKVTIKKGTMNLTVDRSELIEVADTHDGIVFNFKQGVHLYNTDPDNRDSIRSRRPGV